MKRILVILVIGLIVSAHGLSEAQSAQSSSNWNAVNKFDVWKIRTAALTDSFFIAAGDTVWSETILTWPWMTLNVTAALADTVTSGGDSLNTQIDLFQWFEFRSLTLDSANMSYVKTLTFSGNDSSKANQTAIDSEGAWACNITADPIRVQKFSRLRIIALAGTKVLDGEYLRLRMTGWREF